MKLIQEFKDFAVKGNMIDMAVGIIIGASFNKVIDVMVKEVMLPPLSLLSGNMDLNDRRIILKDPLLSDDGTVLREEVAIGYGAMIEAFVDFVIIGFTIFIVVKFLNKLLRRAEDADDKSVPTPKNIELLSQMTHLMEEQNKMLSATIGSQKS